MDGNEMFINMFSSKTDSSQYKVYIIVVEEESMLFWKQSMGASTYDSLVCYSRTLWK